MDSSEFRKRGKEMVDYIADYMENIHTRRVTPEVEPGYLQNMLPDKAPKKGENFHDILDDVEKAIMPGITHWQHPHFHAYFPAGNSYPSILGDMLSDAKGCVGFSWITHWQHPHFHAYFPAGNSYPSILGDMLSDAIGCVGFSWAASPSCTELETIVLDWVGKMIGLPDEFLHQSEIGGGVIQGSASECVLVNLLAARYKAIGELKKRFPFLEDGTLLSKLVAYSSKLAHSCVEKAGMIGFVKMRQLEVDENYALRGHVLERAIEEDRRLGLIPFFVCATLGTTACCSFDNLEEIGSVCERENVWLHVDAAYAGNALVCPEFQHLLRGIENANSLNFNPNKWMLVNFDCSLMWVKDRDTLTSAFSVDPLYLQHKHGDKSIDFRHWGIPLSRRFRSLKLWFVIRSFGLDGLQKYIREHVRLAKLFESHVRKDNRFEIMGKVTMGLVCFRLKGACSLTQKLLRMINESGKIHMVPALLNEFFVIRFAVCAQNANDDDVLYAWDIIRKTTQELLLTRRDSNIDSEKGESESSFDENEEVFHDTEMIFDNQRSNLSRACIRRTLFLKMKMVSDPKCYNPKVLNSLRSESRRHKSDVAYLSPTDPIYDSP